MSEHLPIFTIYDHPSDYPDSIVVVEGHVSADGETRHGVWTTSSLYEARKLVNERRPGVVRIERDPSDDPVIVETWV